MPNEPEEVEDPKGVRQGLLGAFLGVARVRQWERFAVWGLLFYVISVCVGHDPTNEVKALFLRGP